MPHKTLDDRVQGRIKHKERLGPITVLASVACFTYNLTKRKVKAYAWASQSVVMVISISMTS